MKQLPLFSLETSAAEALSIAGTTSGVLLKHRTACVGCYLARFCTLRDVANTYHLPAEQFLSELEQAAHADPSPLTGAHNEKRL